MHLMGPKMWSYLPFSLRHKSNWIFSCRLPKFEQNQSGRFLSLLEYILFLFFIVSILFGIFYYKFLKSNLLLFSVYFFICIAHQYTSVGSFCWIYIFGLVCLTGNEITESIRHTCSTCIRLAPSAWYPLSRVRRAVWCRPGRSSGSASTSARA
jgi:hypothetical protein